MRLCTTTQYTTLTGNTIDGSILDSVSGEIQNACGREFEVGDRAEWYDGDGSRSLLLRVWPVNSITYIAAGMDKASNVDYSGAGKVASLQVTNTGVNCRTFAAGAWDEQDILFADQATVALMRAAIDALDNWTASVFNADLESFPSSFLVRRLAQTATGSLDESLYVPGDPINARHDPETDRMVVSSDCLFPVGTGNVLIYYNAGYTLGDDGDVPDALVGLVARIAGEVETQIESSGFESEKLGDYSYKLGSSLTGISKAVVGGYLDALTEYRALEF